MSFRTVVITRQSKISYKNRFLVVKQENDEKYIHLSEIDTIIVDSAKYFKYNSKWTDIEGYIMQDSLSMSIANREALLITESLEKKKFWFMRLPIWLFGYKNKRLDVVSRNPNTQIQSVEYINVR